MEGAQHPADTETAQSPACLADGHQDALLARCSMCMAETSMRHQQHSDCQAHTARLVAGFSFDPEWRFKPVLGTSLLLQNQLPSGQAARHTLSNMMPKSMCTQSPLAASIIMFSQWRSPRPMMWPTCAVKGKPLWCPVTSISKQLEASLRRLATRQGGHPGCSGFCFQQFKS